MKELDKKLTSAQKSELKGKAHNLKPIIMLGSKGLTEAVRLETDKALEVHELIKVRVTAEDRDTSHAMAAELCELCDASLINFIGRIAVLYRKRKG